MRNKTRQEPTSNAMNNDEIQPLSSAIVQQVKDVLISSALPRSAYWLRRRLSGDAAIRLYSALNQLENEREIEYGRDGTWFIPHPIPEVRGTAFDPMSLVGPVWEPKVVEALKSNGVPVEQQRHEFSYYLDIAIICHNGKKLNIEVDGRTHRRYDGRRRTADLIRDARLCSNGWTVHRIWVKDLITDFDGQIDQAVKTWKQLEGEE